MSLLSDYLDRPALKAELNVCDRTLSRYENMVDGLPSLSVGGRKLYRREAVLDWLKKRERKPNPRRSARA